MFKLFQSTNEDENCSIDYLKEQYYKNRYRNSRRANDYLKRWDQQYLVFLESAIDSNDYNQFFAAILSDDMPSCPIEVNGIMQKTHCIQMARIMASSFIYKLDQARIAKDYYCKLMHINILSESQIDDLMKVRKNLSIMEINEAENISEIKEALQSTVIGKSVFCQGIKKWLNFCLTIEDFKNLKSYIKEIYSPNDIPLELKVIDEAMEKIMLKEIPMTKSIERAKKLFFLYENNDAIKFFAFECWLNLCRTAEEANEAFNHAPRECKMKTYKRMKKLACEEVNIQSD